MIITGILMYLLWPAFIGLSLIVIRMAVAGYEKKFPGD
jgi:hypothetical protein